jgi:3,4-dihydroxy-2-butanone 4-phosphate synthase
MKLAGLKPVAIICEMINDDGTMCKGGQITKFAVENGLTVVSTEEVYEAVYKKSL